MAVTDRYYAQCAHPLEERLSLAACDPKVGAGVLIERGQELLLLLRPADNIFGPDTWGIPAGFVEHDTELSAKALDNAMSTVRHMAEWMSTMVDNLAGNPESRSRVWRQARL